MATFHVYSDLQTSLKLPESQVVLFGRHKLLKSLAFNGVLTKKLGPVDEKLFAAALGKLQPGSSIPIYLDLAQVYFVAC
jgi:hypothetical protein